MNTDLTSKKAVITGASSGIGKAIATKLVSHGCHVYVLDIQDTLGESTVEELSKIGTATYVHCDVSSEDAVKNSAKKIGMVNYIINVAGISLQEKKGEVSERNFDKLVAINMRSVYLMSLVFGHHHALDGGAIVNISSVRAKTGTPSFSSGYAAAKAGVENLTKSFALELAPKNIRVNCIAPGATYPTKMSENWSDDVKNEIISSIPLGRLGSPEDMANCAYFLVSDLSKYITGQTINVNGGAWMG